MTTFKPGDLILVRKSTGDWEERKLVIEHGGLFWCEADYDPDILVDWDYAKPLKRGHYDIDTFPKGPVWLRRTGYQESMLVCGRYETHVNLATASVSYNQLPYYEISTDEINWRTCVPE